MGKRVAIVQSSYIPWRGYFDLIRSVDEFVLLDDAQYTKADWRNRNRVKTRHGDKWLTIPVATRARRGQSIASVEVADSGWRRRHWRTLYHEYRSAPCFGSYRDRVEALYLEDAETRLSIINYRFLAAICDILEIRTPISWSAAYPGNCRGSERLIEICKACGASIYLSGPRGRNYLDYRAFSEAGIELQFHDYPEYPSYPQQFPPYFAAVSALDLIFNVGGRARYYLDPPGSASSVA